MRLKKGAPPESAARAYKVMNSISQEDKDAMNKASAERIAKMPDGRGAANIDQVKFAEGVCPSILDDITV